MYPAWNATFDAHIYEGRVLEVLLMKTAEESLAEATVGVSVLAERCRKANGRAEFWVGPQTPDPHLLLGPLSDSLPPPGGPPSLGEGHDGGPVLPGGR